MIRKVWQRIKQGRAWLSGHFPGNDVFAGAGRALRVAGWLLLVPTLLVASAQSFSWQAATAVPLLIFLAWFTAMGVMASVGLIRQADHGFLKGLSLFGVVAFGVLVAPADFAGFMAALALGIAVALIGGGVAVYRRRGLGWQSVTAAGLGVIALAAWIIAALLPSWPTSETRAFTLHEVAQLSLPDPSLPGPTAFEVVYYGSGDNPQRPEFGADVDLVTEPVDGSKLIDGWSGRGGWVRTSYWDVTPERLPVNGKAWVPSGEGPFPVVLIVHGNHGMEDFSDTGYDYLGELFASQGMLTVSVDQNFLNGSAGDLWGIPDVGLEKENDARGWLLLKHLEQLREWNADPQHALSGKADLDRVVLVGHSRGGEAVSEAAVFNRLPAYPDDALLPFDFNFGIRGVIAIAPVDRQYHPRNDSTVVRDVSYLVIHGSHDGDVSSYSGYATYNRTRFDTCSTCFKAGYYVVGANHGQFNTSWGDTDYSTPLAQWLNRNHLISGEDQRQIASVLFTAFLRATVFDESSYLPFLAAPAKARSFFPDATQMLAQFEFAGETVVANFLEDDDVSSATLAGASISEQGLSLWREQFIELKWHKSDSAAAIIGWNAEDAEERSVPPRYSLQLPTGSLNEESVLALSLAAVRVTPGEVDGYKPPKTVDFSIEITDANGQSASLPLSQRRALAQPIEPQVMKLHSLHDERSEVVFDRYAFALSEWRATNDELDLNRIESIALVFDRTAAAAIALERVSIQTGF